MFMNQMILNRASKIRYEVKDIAPNTFEAMIKNYSERKVITVWSGGSDATIFSDAKVNYAFRAWHDATHVKHGYDFSLQGEASTAKIQCNELTTDIGQAIIMTEVVEQARHFFDKGYFPLNQSEFMLQVLSKHYSITLR